MMISRRGLIGGLAALVTAPAIVRVESLMPVKLVDLNYTRYIFDYFIATDSVIIRIDKSNRPLREFRGHMLRRDAALKYFPAGIEKELSKRLITDDDFHQVYADVHISHGHLTHERLKEMSV
jgi:hypothetical protein